jgi:hypothetical protein
MLSGFESNGVRTMVSDLAKLRTMVSGLAKLRTMVSGLAKLYFNMLKKDLTPIFPNWSKTALAIFTGNS